MFAKAVARNFKSKNRNAIFVSKCDEYRKYWALINASSIIFGFALDLSDMNLLYMYRFVRYRFRFV